MNYQHKLSALRCPPLAVAALAVAALSALTTTGNAGVIFTDTFTGVAASSGQTSTGLNGAGWYMYNNAGAGEAFTTATDNTPPLMDGTAMQNPGSSSSNTVANRQFSTTSLTNVGDSITLSLDLHALSTTASFNFSLVQSAVTLSGNTYDPTNPLADADGYGFHLGSTQERVFLTAGTGSLWEVTNASPIPYATYLTNVSASTPITTDARTFTLTLTKTAGGVQIDSSYAGTAFASYEDTTGNIYTSFNTVRIYANAGTSGFNIDNVSVSTIPEPSTVALVLLASGLVLVCSSRRSRAGKTSAI